jgi:hypothetical protein
MPDLILLKGDDAYSLKEIHFLPLSVGLAIGIYSHNDEFVVNAFI